MASSGLIQFPTCAFLDPTGRVSRPWQQWLQNPSCLTLSGDFRIDHQRVDGLGTIAVQNSNAVTITGGTISGGAISGSTISGGTISGSHISGGTISGVTATELTEYYAPTTGFSYTPANATNVLILKPAGVLASGSVTMPAAPQDGQVLRITSSSTITSFTIVANSGQAVNAPSTAIALGFASWIYRAADTTWYRI